MRSTPKCEFVFTVKLVVWVTLCGSILRGFTKATKPPLQQHFLQTPKDMVAVEGSTVDFPCQVGDLSGDVQWAKDGFLLGFDPNIPGYKRYTMNMDVAKGIYNLRIHNVQMDDEAEYQCQVGPGPNNKPIRAEARITVIVPPKVLEIRGQKNGSTVEMREGQKLSLQCIAKNSKPATKLKWLRNGLDITKDVVPYKEDASTSNLKSTSTSITLSPKLDDNGAIYSCVGEHPAVTRQLRTNVFLSVLFPPGPPQIEGYHEGDIVQVGDKLTLACISRGGNPPARLIWLRNDEQVDVTYSTGGREATNTHTFTVGPKDNKAVYKCEASNTVTLQPLSASVRLNVLFAPTKVTITGPKEVRIGDSVTMSCITGSSNPAVEVSWVVDGRPMMSTQAVTEDIAGGWITSSNVTVSVSRQDPNAKTFTCYAVSEALGETIVQTATVAVVYPPGAPLVAGYDSNKPWKAGELQKVVCTSSGGNPQATLKWYKNDKEIRGVEKSTSSTSTNELIIRADESDNGATYRCDAINSALKKPLTASLKPSVLFPPTSVTIKVKPRKPKAGDSVVLTCETASSNPEATVLWWKDGESITGTHDGVLDAANGGKSTRNKVRFNVTSLDDMSSYTCQATNHLLKKTVHDNFSLRVLYKPEFLIQPAERFDVMEGESVVVNATARANPPQVTYSWTRNGLPLLDMGDGSTRPAIQRFGHRAVYRGPLLELSDVSRDDGGEYGCEAANTEGVTFTSVNINVIYPARITKLSRTVVAGSGEHAEFECEAVANPFVSRMIVWKRPGFDMGRTHEAVEKGKSVLTVINVTRLDAGQFECVAFNGIGTEASQYAQLIVKCEFGEHVEFECEAVANPFVSRMIVWKRPGFDMGRMHEAVEKGKSVLTVINVTRLDAGQFECVAFNGIGTEASQYAQLIVKFKPEVRLPHGFTDVAGEEGEAARLVCLAEGAPAISFVWSYNGGVIGDKFSSVKYASQAAQLDDVTWESVLFVKHLQANDFGYYTCVARNELGHDHVKVKLRRRGPPDPPYNIRIVNSSSDSVVLSWTPGYSSGLPQQFRIRYAETGTDESRFIDVFPTNATVFIITGLKPEKEYSFSMSSRNMLGESLYSIENTRAITQKWKGSPTTPTGASLDAPSEELPRLLLVVVSVVGSLLLILNIILVICFIKRKKSRHNQGRGSPKTLTQTTTPDSLMYTPSKYQQSINGEAICQVDDKDSYQEEILMKELFLFKKVENQLRGYTSRTSKNKGCLLSPLRNYGVARYKQDTKKQVSEKCMSGYQTSRSYELSQSRKKDNCPDILKNRGMDHVSLQSVPLTDPLSSTEVIITEDPRFPRRVMLPSDDSSLCQTSESPPPGSCVLGTVGSHLV